MDYEKLALAKEALDSGSYDKETIEYIFPELKEEPEEERIRKAIIDFFSEPGRKEYILNGFTVDDILAWLKYLKDRIQPQPKQEWSEEDEYNLLSAIKKLEKLAENEKRVAERDNWERTYVLIDWIKSLKDKIQSLSRPKEWSEEDERMRQYVVNDLMCVKELVNDPNYAVSVESVEKEIDWMESLKERIG